MSILTFDTETHLIKPGLAAPRLVCVSYVERERDQTSTPEVGLLNREDGIDFIREALEDESVVIVGHQIFYDLGVLCAEDPVIFVPLVFKALRAYRIRDTIVRQQLIDIATGNLKYRWDEEEQEYVKTGYSLADLALRLLNRVLPKTDTWRLKYALLDGVPIVQWPDDARKYATDDALVTEEVFWHQEGVAGGPIPTEERATREAWALWLMSAWGIRTDAAAVAALKKELEAEQAIAMQKLAPTGIIVWNKSKGQWSKKMAEIYKRVKVGFEAQSKDVPFTPKGKPSSEAATLTDSGDKDLLVLAEAAKGGKLLNTYIPLLEGGSRVPINARFNVLVESNRTSCSKPNLQNPPRKGGVREAFVARPGTVFCSVDYDTIELRSLAQSCLDLLGHSAMAEALRNGEDLHLNLAAEILGIDRAEAKRRFDAGDEEVAEARQISKPANFGFPGGMQPDAFVDYCKGYGVTIDRELSRTIYDRWRHTWPEMHHYFNLVKSMVGAAGEGKVISPRSGFVRGGLRFTQLSNHYFQSLTATGAKDALWHVNEECYDKSDSPLYGSRPVVFMHDEIFTEMLERIAAEAAERQAELMIEVMERWIPDIPIKASAVLMRRWYKGAKPVRVDGRLVPSKPEKREGATIWVPDMPERAERLSA